MQGPQAEHLHKVLSYLDMCGKHAGDSHAALAHIEQHLKQMLTIAVVQQLVVLFQNLAQRHCINFGILSAPMCIICKLPIL